MSFFGWLWGKSSQPPKIPEKQESEKEPETQPARDEDLNESLRSVEQKQHHSPEKNDATPAECVIPTVPQREEKDDVPEIASENLQTDADDALVPPSIAEEPSGSEDGNKENEQKHDDSNGPSLVPPSWNEFVGSFLVLHSLFQVSKKIKNALVTQVLFRACRASHSRSVMRDMQRNVSEETARECRSDTGEKTTEASTTSVWSLDDGKGCAYVDSTSDKMVFPIEGKNQWCDVVRAICETVAENERDDAVILVIDSEEDEAICYDEDLWLLKAYDVDDVMCCGGLACLKRDVPGITLVVVGSWIGEGPRYAFTRAAPEAVPGARVWKAWYDGSLDFSEFLDACCTVANGTGYVFVDTETPGRWGTYSLTATERTECRLVPSESLGVAPIDGHAHTADGENEDTGSWDETDPGTEEDENSDSGSGKKSDGWSDRDGENDEEECSDGHGDETDPAREDDWSGDCDDDYDDDEKERDCRDEIEAKERDTERMLYALIDSDEQSLDESSEKHFETEGGEEKNTGAPQISVDGSSLDLPEKKTEGCCEADDTRCSGTESFLGSRQNGESEEYSDEDTLVMPNGEKVQRFCIYDSGDYEDYDY